MSTYSHYLLHYAASCNTDCVFFLLELALPCTLGKKVLSRVLMRSVSHMCVFSTVSNCDHNRMFKTDLGLKDSFNKLVKEEGAAFMMR